MKRLLLALATLTVLATPPAVAQNPQQDAPEYLVEVVVFRHTRAFDAGELWTPAVPLYVPPPVVAEDLEEVLPPRAIGRFEPLSAEQFALTEAVSRLSKAGDFSVLSHSGWRQSALPDEEAQAKSLSGRDRIGRVNGTVLLSRSRYLRLDFDLLYRTDSGEYPLRQDRRRVQTGVTHYIDHPHFGLLVLVSRAPKPQP